MKKVVLAYSGGLDTSVCVAWLSRERGYDVYCFAADVGQGVDAKRLKYRAKISGAKDLVVVDLKKQFVHDFIFPSLRAGAVYESKYLLATSLSRPLIAQAQVAYAKRIKAGALAHGCTGKGNDQVRFEVTYAALAPGLEIVAPLREWHLKSRQEELDYARENGIPLEFGAEKLYSIDKNLWGISIESGPLEDPWTTPPEEAYLETSDPKKAPNRPETITISFEKGIPVGLNGKRKEPVALIETLRKLIHLLFNF